MKSSAKSMTRRREAEEIIENTEGADKKVIDDVPV